MRGLSRLKISLIGFADRQAYNAMLTGHSRITGSHPQSVLKLRRFQLVTSLAARCRALLSARPRRTGAELGRTERPRHPSHMTTEEVEDVARALTAVVENLEASAAKQSMQEAFMQVRAYAGENKPREPTTRSDRLNLIRSD